MRERLLYLVLLGFTLCTQLCANGDSLRLVPYNPDQPFYNYQGTAFNLMKDSVKVDPLGYAITLKGKGQFIRYDSLITITALEQALTLTIREKAAPGNRWRIQLKPKQNPHFTKAWKELERGETPGFTDRDALSVFRNYMTYRFLDQPVPDFREATVRGRPITHESFKGHVTMINFWFYGCHGCMMEIPALNRLDSAYEEDDQVQLFAFFRDSITVGDNNRRLYGTPSMLGTNISEMAPISAYPFKQSDPENFDLPQIPNAEDLIKPFNVRSFPTTMIIDKNGIIRYIKVGVRGSISFDAPPEPIFRRLKRKVEQIRN